MYARISFMTRLLGIALLFAAAAAQAADRFPVMAPEQMTPELTKLVQGLLAGPRGGGDASPEAVKAILNRGPFNAWLRSPELGDRLQKVGEYIRFNTSLPLPLNEFAILITARTGPRSTSGTRTCRSRSRPGSIRKLPMTLP